MYTRRVKLSPMRPSLDRPCTLLVVAGCALLLACGSEPAAGVASTDAGVRKDASISRDAAAASGGSSAADSGRPDAGMKPQAGAGAGGQPARADAGHAVDHSQAGAAGQAGAGGAAGTAAMSCTRCTAYATPMQTGSVAPSELSALSGLAMSRAQPEILFAHNDHDRPVVYALDLQGRLHARVTLDGAETTDIEDIAVGPCGTQTCVYLADIGDNAATRQTYSVLRFAQPEVPSTPGDTAMTLGKTSYEQIHFTYDDGSHNAESLMVAPNGNLYVVTKLAPGSGGNVAAQGPSSVYRIEASAFGQSTNAEAVKVSTLPVPKSGEGALSAAAAHPCGLGFLARTYDRVYEFLTPAGADFEQAFTATPQMVGMPDEPQSEGIDYRSDGRGFVTSGEGSAAPIVLTACVP